MKRIIPIIFFLLMSMGMNATQQVYYWDSISVDKTQTVVFCSSYSEKIQPSPILKSLFKNQFNNRRITAAILAFPFPFGIVGLHRIFLGTKPYVPVAYIASLGGIFGILPLIDFFVIIFEKDFSKIENNEKVLMWVK